MNEMHEVWWPTAPLLQVLAGDVAILADGTRLLIGDMNRAGGICDDCPMLGVVAIERAGQIIARKHPA